MPFPLPIKRITFVQLGNATMLNMLAFLTASRVYPDWSIEIITPLDDNANRIESMLNWIWCSNIRLVNLDDILFEFDDELFSSWESLKDNPVLASDLLRVYYVARHGGMYLDTDILSVRQFDMDVTYKVVLCREMDGNHFVANTNAWFYSPFAEHRFMKYWLNAFYPSRTMLNPPTTDILSQGFMTFSLEDWKGDYSLGYPTLLANIIAPYLSEVIDSSYWYEPRDVYTYFASESSSKVSGHAYGYHLWNSFLSTTGLTQNLTSEWLSNNRTTLIYDILKQHLADIKRLETWSFS